MKATPTKFQAITFGKTGTRNMIDFTFENITIYYENSVDLLGIETEHSLTFNICKKAARQLAVFTSFGNLLTRKLQGKLAIFKCFITSNFDYLIWHCLAGSTNKLCQNTERARRFIYNGYSSTHNNLLQVRREYAMR